MFYVKQPIRLLFPLFLAAAASATTWCVNPSGANGCKTTIGAAVTAAASGDTVSVAAGTYKETITINMPLTLSGADAATTIIEAKGLGNGIYVDGIDNANLAGVFISGFTVQDANFEGILVTNATGITISGNIVQGNNVSLVPSASGGTCPGIPSFETNEDDDCGEGIHFSGVSHSSVSGNTIQNNAGGVLLSDDTGATHDNVISGNLVTGNAFDCGITIASHVPATLTKSTTPLGVYSNTVVGNQSTNNGLKGFGTGIGIFASAPGTASYGNLVINNTSTGNGIPGVAIHGHTPGQNLNNNVIIGNTLSGNGVDQGDAATKAPAGINFFSVTPVTGTVIAENTISGEGIGVVINAPGSFIVQRNTFTRGSVGVMNSGSGTVSADGNYWGCASDPRISSPFVFCAGTSGAVTITTWVTAPPSK